ncbi:MAG: LysM peptidoglycan-binding domain-containing protein [Caldilineaceae bacterium]|nr:LysM peptidoglycan-binding domain-containing protein [Caldilineaceae bacterium]
MLTQLLDRLIQPRQRTCLLVCLLLVLILLPAALLAQEGDEPPIHIVQLGDTLSEIAQQYGTDMETLRRLNGLGDVDYVWIGQRLVLPATQLVDDAPTATVVDATAVATEGGTDAGETDAVATAKPTVAESATAAAEADASEPTPVSAEAIRVDNTLSPVSTATPENRAGATQAVTPAATPKATLVDPATLSEPVVDADLKTDIYIVQAGDTLSQIAVRYRTTLAHLIEFNQISPAQRLQAGQALVVPVAGRAIAAIPTVAPLEHIVQPGEQLGMIAARYDLSTADIMRANRLADADLLVAGQRLLIPQGPDPQDALAYLENLRTGSDGYHVHTEFPTLTEKWIDVDLSEQRLVAYRGKKPIRTFIISSGLPNTPTVTGSFRIWAKTPIQDMYAGNRAAGYSYYISDVQWVQYFYKDYGFHAAYWHDNFGQPMSHGCINLRTDDAKWLFDWASPTMTARDGWFISDEENPGTLVVVHE